MTSLAMHYSAATLASSPSIPVPRNLLSFSQEEAKAAALVWSPPPEAVGHAIKPLGSPGVAAPMWMSLMAEQMAGGGAGHHLSSHHQEHPGASNTPVPTPTPTHTPGPPSHHTQQGHFMWNGLDGKINSDHHHHHHPQQHPHPPITKEQDHCFRIEHPASPYRLSGPGSVEENRLENNLPPPSLYGPRSNSAESSSSPPIVTSSHVTSAGSMLVVPQPINAVSKMSSGAHTPTQGSGNPPSQSGRKYSCKMCPQIFGSKADLQLHTQIHMREAKPYKCSQCTKAFANSSYLSQHTRIHLGIKPYRCEICQRKFTQLSHLQQHIRTHTGDKPYKCRHPGCTKAFSQLSNLQSHSRCHQTDKPYKCNSCYKCFADEPSLLEHIPKHKESKHLKTHICQYCGKSYTQETYLVKHMQKHAERNDKRGIMRENPYWPKTDSPLDGYNTDRLSEPVSLQQGLGGEDLRRDLQHLSPHHLATIPYDSPIPTSKSMSAFTPIQSGTLMPLGGGSQLGMQAAPRPYYSFDPIFSKSNPVSSMADVKPTPAFPNQLISLHQISNYAHRPPIAPTESLLGLSKDKSQ